MWLIGKCLKRWGFTPQWPVRRALEQRKIAKWLKETCTEVPERARLAKEWLADRIKLVYLSPYAPESNADEYLLNRHFKTALRTGRSAASETVKAYFRHPAAAYAAQGI